MINSESNPYQTPKNLLDYDGSVGNLNANALVELIERRLDNRIDGEDFERLLEQYGDSRDEKVKYAADMLLETEHFCWDEISKVDKPEWDFVQRTKLMLLCEVEIRQTKIEGASLFFKFFCLLLFAVQISVLVLFGFGLELLCVTVVLGIVFWSANWLNDGENGREWNLPFMWQQVAPFYSVGELEKAINLVNFKKRKFPGGRVQRKSGWFLFWGPLGLLTGALLTILLLPLALIAVVASSGGSVKTVFVTEAERQK